jgi:RimJ/RimL family protein N-acetyltransferase
MAIGVMNTPSIETSRLVLIPLSPVSLRAMLEGNYLEAGAAAGIKVAADCSLLRHSSIRRRLDLIERDPDQQPWMYRAIVFKDEGAMAGHISFHHKAPDPDLLEYSTNAVELGYTIEERYRRRGYAKESVLAMMDWANRRGIGTFILSISPANAPSIALAEAIGYRKISERMDDTDGLEYVYRMDMQETRQG